MKNIRIPHQVIVYEESIDGLVRREIARLSFCTAEYEQTPPDERAKVYAEVV